MQISHPRFAPFSAYLADKPHPELFTNFVGKKVRLIREYIRYSALENMSQDGWKSSAKSKHNTLDSPAETVMKRFIV